jgi:N-methylhydantoinase A
MVRNRFDELHEMYYTFRLADQVEVVDVRLVGLGRVQRPLLKEYQSPESNIGSAVKGDREVDFDDFGIRQAKVYERDRLPARARAKGPAIVEEPASTTVVYPGQEFEVDGLGNLKVDTLGGG